jgi:hypothetical protein
LPDATGWPNHEARAREIVVSYENDVMKLTIDA